MRLELSKWEGIGLLSASQPAPIDLDIPSPRRPADCPVEDWLGFLGHRWNALILWHLSTGPKRFSELTEHLPGITPKVLTERLGALSERQLLVRSRLMTFPRGTTYEISNRGSQIVGILDQIEMWSRSARAELIANVLEPGPR